VGEDDTRVPTSRPSVPELFARLIADVRAWVQAEIALLKSRSGALVSSLRAAIFLITAAAVLATVGLFAMAIGLIMALATVIGPAWATVIVVVTLFTLAALFGWLGWKRIDAVFEDRK
jgi:fatty acid desaturase